MKLFRPHCIRVAVENWIDPERFGELTDLLAKYPGGIGQVALFTSAVHSPLTLEELGRRAEIMKDRFAVIREKGLSPAVNILATVGHHEEDLGHTPAGNYTLMTGADGRVCRGSVCMNDGRYLCEIVIPAYRILAGTGPDAIWVDDDVRYGHIPIGNGCFCESCIALFNRENGTSFTRETLVGALEAGDPDVRQAWLKHNSGAISRLLGAIGDTVREIDPGIRLGFMTGERYFEGYAFSEWAEALSGGGKYPISWRPGGGAYEDICFDTIVEKSEQIGRQNAYLPAYVTESVSEVENFPYQMIRKSPVSTAVEGAWNMTAGCTGAAFNILPSETGEPVSNAEAHLRAIDGRLPLYRLLAEKTAGKQPVGIGTAWRPDDQRAVPGSFIGGWGGMYASYARELFDFGLPECYRPDRAVVTLLTGGCLGVFSDEEILSLLRGGVYADAGALGELDRRGFSALAGFGAGEAIPADARERYEECPINAGIAGGIRNARQAFHPGDSFALIPRGEDGRTGILSSLVDYHGGVLASCCLGTYENREGGRLAAAGYYPYSWISDAFKTAQLKRLMLWLSGGRLPSWVDTCCRIRNRTFAENGKTTVALFNPTNAPIEGLTVAVRTNCARGTFTDQRGGVRRPGGEKREGPAGFAELTEKYRFFAVGTLAPYEIGILEAEDEN